MCDKLMSFNFISFGMLKILIVLKIYLREHYIYIYMNSVTINYYIFLYRTE